MIRERELKVALVSVGFRFSAGIFPVVTPERDTWPIMLRDYVADAPCSVFAFFLVLLQYTVFESLYGFDGDNARDDDSLHVIHPRIHPDPGLSASIPPSLV
jgi:hypothetical protein